ncbi:MAG: COX15/CtaA family protein [Actinobacteria bacterium]|nr:COX15/CtaA family protein [Actinomycetota bacterium]
MRRAEIERALTPLLGLLLFLQSAIVVTGGAVRLTGSGLGCPTWPECTPGSIKPVPDQVQGQVHAWIEFGNRLLTFVLIFSSVAVLIAVRYLKRRDIRTLAIFQLLGIFAQIPLGGITVLTHLNPIPVAGHFLLSIILIAAGTSLFERRNLITAPNEISKLPQPIFTRAHLALTTLVIIVGTIVTGSGPNAGDWSAPRFHIRIQLIAWIHAGLVIALMLLSIYLYLRATKGSLFKQRLLIFLLLSLGQGAIGFIQFYQGVPELLVGAHLIGVTLVWIGAWRIHLVAK